jgi:hypothetical protein
MRPFLFVLCCFWVLSQCSGFLPSFRLEAVATTARLHENKSLPFSATAASTTTTSLAAGRAGQGKISNSIATSVGLFLSGAIIWIPTAALATTDVELADLPPPYVPVIFGLVLIAGVGVLTGSLGDVIDDEAQLGLQSGARAKKEIERTRSSYFKKK